MDEMDEIELTPAQAKFKTFLDKSMAPEYSIPIYGDALRCKIKMYYGDWVFTLTRLDDEECESFWHDCRAYLRYKATLPLVS